MNEIFDVRFAGKWITYRVVRSARRRKTVALAIEPDGTVKVVAPLTTPRDRLSDIVRARGAWILGLDRRRAALLPPPSPREMVSGEGFLYLGRNYRLKVEPVAKPAGKVRLEGGWLVAEVPAELAAAERAAKVRAGLIAWYREHAASHLPVWVRGWALTLGIEPANVLIREQRKRWASCDAKGNLRFNWRILQAPRQLVYYVIVHELIHLSHPRHDREFWAALASAMPDYETRREELRLLGGRLVW